MHVALLRQRIGVGGPQRLYCSRTHIAEIFARIDLQRAGAHGVDVGQHLLLRAFAQRHHRYYRGNADDNAEHGQ
ncbi:hypothetical protein D3C71_1460790 [compost metagenome]